MVTNAIFQFHLIRRHVDEIEVVTFMLQLFFVTKIRSLINVSVNIKLKNI